MCDKTNKVVPLKRRKCPICGKPAQERYCPFCSKRCADVDLGRWFGETYRAASEDEPDADDGTSDEQ